MLRDVDAKLGACVRVCVWVGVVVAATVLIAMPLVRTPLASEVYKTLLSL